MSAVADAPVKTPARGGRFADRNGLLAVLDQAVASGTNFLTIVMVGRACGTTELGYYSLGFTVVVLVAALQEALVTAPYTVFRERLHGRERAEYAGRVLVQQVTLALLAAAGVAAAAVAGGEQLGPVAWAVAAVVPMTLLRDFCRRLAFADLRMAGALGLDVAVAVFQLGAIYVLMKARNLNAVVAFTVLGVVCGLVGLTALLLTRRDYTVRGERAGREVGRHWVFGRWVAAGQMVAVAHGYVIHWLLAVMLGASATGAFAACVAVATLTNPFYLGVSNVLGPWVARARTTGGKAEIRRVVGRAAAFLLVVMGGFTGLLVIAGGPILRLLYKRDYDGYSLTLTLVAAALAVNTGGMAADHGLRALERPRAAFLGSLIGIAVTITSAALLIPQWGIAGAALGYLIGNVAGTLARGGAFLWLSSRRGEVGE